MTTAEGGLSLVMRAAIDACAHGIARGLEALAEHEATMLRAAQDERTEMLQAVAEREAVMLRAVQNERESALRALAEREAETSAGREALATDRAALDSEIGVMEAAVRC